MQLTGAASIGLLHCVLWEAARECHLSACFCLFQVDCFHVTFFVLSATIGGCFWRATGPKSPGFSLQPMLMPVVACGWLTLQLHSSDCQSCLNLRPRLHLQLPRLLTLKALAVSALILYRGLSLSQS